MLAFIGLGVIWLGVMIVRSWGDEYVAMDAMSVGDCVELDITSELFGPRLQLVGCDGSHAAEVVAVGVVPEELNADRQGAMVAVRELCSNSLAAYTGGRFGRSELEFLATFPTEEDWSPFGNDYACLAARPDGGDLEGSVRAGS